MKTNFKIAWLIALLAGMPLLLSAQEKDRSSLPREVLSPEKAVSYTHLTLPTTSRV